MTPAETDPSGHVDLDTEAEMESLGRVVRARRKELCMSQLDVAELCGGEVRGVQRIELATHSPVFSRLLLVCRALGWTLTDLAAAMAADQRAEPARKEQSR